MLSSATAEALVARVELSGAVGEGVGDLVSCTVEVKVGVEVDSVLVSDGSAGGSGVILVSVLLVAVMVVLVQPMRMAPTGIFSIKEFLSSDALFAFTSS